MPGVAGLRPRAAASPSFSESGFYAAPAVSLP
jgi:hypothetical protein